MHIHATLKCHTLAYAGFTHARDAAAAAARCTIMRSREENVREREKGKGALCNTREKETETMRRRGWERDRERERERERDREMERERGNTGRCTWKLCGAVKPRRLLFTICRDHTKFIRRDHTTPIDTWGRPLFRVRASPYPNYPHVARVGRYTPAVLIANHCGRREKGPWLLSCVLDNEIRRKLCHNRYRKLTLRQLPQLCIQSQRRQCRHSHGILRRNRTSGLKRIAHWEVLQERRKKHRKVASRFTLQLPKLCFILNFSRYFCENVRWCVRT